MVRCVDGQAYCGLHRMVQCKAAYTLANIFGKFIFPQTFSNLGRKWRTNCAGSYVTNFGEIGKSSHKHGREQKFRWTWYLLSRKHLSCLSKKPTRVGSQTFRANIVFVNIMLASGSFTDRYFATLHYTVIFCIL